MLGSLDGFCRIEFQLSPQAAKSQPEMVSEGILGSLGVSQLLMFSSLTGMKENPTKRVYLFSLLVFVVLALYLAGGVTNSW